MNGLDRPVWASLATTHARLSVGDDMARRYEPEVNRFASARDDSDAALRALAHLVSASDQVFVLQAPPIEVPAGLADIKLAKGVQMVAHDPVAPPPEGSKNIVALGEPDAAEMLALATLTEPGPFLRQTHRFPGYTEVSGVCTHPDFRGHGFAKRLSRHVAAAISARGETAFLHAWKSNVAAIALYESLGFRWRCDVNVAVLERRSEAGPR
jgi:ribosomal protein S18 acetylase RimI-like enzyme